MIVKLVARSALAIVTLLLAVVLAPTTQAATHQTVPSANFSFIPTLQTFLQSEDANRYADLYPNAVVSGGIHSTAAGLTGSPSALLAYLAGVYTTESGTITYPDTSVCWVIAHTDTTGNLGSFTRVSGTHYLINCGAIPQPTLPSLPNVSSVYLMKVTTTGGAITEVVDLRPWGGQTGFDACKYVSLNAAITALGTRPATIILNCHLPVTANVSIPATANVLPTRNSAFAVESSVTITASSPRQFPLSVDWQIFEGASTTPISFTNPGNVRPEWWGGGTSAAAATQTTAITYAINSQPANSYTSNIFFGHGTYQHDNTLNTNSRNICFRGEGRNSTSLELTTTASGRHAFKVTGTTQFQCAVGLSFYTSTPLVSDLNMTAVRMDGSGDAPNITSDAEQVIIDVGCIGYNLCFYGDGNGSFDLREQLISDVYAVIGGSGSTSGTNEGIVCQRIIKCDGDHIYIDGAGNADHGLYSLSPLNLFYTHTYITGTANEAVKLIPTSGVAGMTDPYHWTFRDSTLIANGGSITVTIDQDYDLAKLDLTNLVIQNDTTSISNGYAIVIQTSDTAILRNVDLSGLSARDLLRGGVEFISNNTSTIQNATLLNVHAYNWGTTSAGTLAFIGVAENGSSTLSSLTYGGYFDGNSNGRSIFAGGNPRAVWDLVQALNVTEKNVSVPEGHPLISRMATSTASIKLAGNLYCTMVTTDTGADTTETDLASYTMPAGAIDTSVSGVTSYAGVHIRAWGATAANANTKTIRLYFGGTAIDSNSVTTAPNNQDWVVDTYMHRLDSTNQKGMTRFDVGAVTQGVNNISTTANLANTVIIKVTGQNGSASASDISLRGFCVDGLPN